MATLVGDGTISVAPLRENGVQGREAIYEFTWSGQLASHP